MSHRGSQKIRVVCLPVGEAPLWVREAWIGLELPLVRHTRPKSYLGFGVLSSPISYVGQLWGLLRGQGIRIAGYPVYASEAVDLLAATNPEAANWWHSSVPHLLKPGRKFLFDSESCMTVGDPGSVEQV